MTGQNKFSPILAGMLMTMVVGRLLSPTPARAQSSLDPALAFGAISGAKVTVGKRASITGTAGAINDLVLKKNAFVSGNGTSLGSKIKLGKSATVSGVCATSGGKITVAKNAACTGGTSTSGTNPAIIPLQTFASLGATACPPLGIGQGDLNLKKNGSDPLVAVSGVNVFDFTSIKLGKSASISITGPADALVIINDSGPLTMEKNASISATGLMVGNFLVVGGSATLKSGSNLVATLVTAKNCDVETNAKVNGQLFCAGNLTLGSSATVSDVLLNQSVANAVTCPG